jgi:hypothetical protein
MRFLLMYTELWMVVLFANCHNKPHLNNKFCFSKKKKFCFPRQDIVRLVIVGSNIE